MRQAQSDAMMQLSSLIMLHVHARICCLPRRSEGLCTSGLKPETKLPNAQLREPAQRIAGREGRTNCCNNL